MKLVLSIFGAVLALLGGVWILQGFNVLPGSFMTGQIKWAIYGSLAVAVGLLMIFAATKMRGAPRSK
jgi:hypothetical protein